MRSFFQQKKFTLQFHITTLFAILITISGLLLGGYSYSQLSETMIDSGKTLFSNSSKELVDKIKTENVRVHRMLKILSASNLSQQTSRQEKIKSLPILSEMLEGANSLSAMFVSYTNGDFFLYKKIHSKDLIQKYDAPIDSYFMMTLRQSGNTVHQFYDVSIQLLKEIKDPNYRIQITQRPWYQKAKQSQSYIITQPYLFYASQEFGVTMAIEDKKNGSVIGADYSLGRLSTVLHEFQAYPSSQRIVVDKQGLIIAYQDETKLLSEQGKFDNFKSIGDIKQPVLSYAFKHHQQQQGSILFSFQGEDWLGKVTVISTDHDFLLLQAVKTKELLADAYQARYKSIFITLLIILATLPIAWYFARLLTAPISGLTKDLQKIKNFDFNSPIEIKTPIKEIAELITVTNNMKGTISHFQELSASLVSKQSFQQLMHKISAEFNSTLYCEGTLIIINDKDTCEIKHCNLRGLNTYENEQLTEKASLLNLSCETLYDSLSSHIIPVDVRNMLSKYFNDIDTLTWRLVPMKNRSGRDLGLIAIIEPYDNALNVGKQQYAQAIAGFSALAIQSQLLLAEQKNLLQSFILLIAGAIDSKSPYTGGHCARVPELTKMLSKAACEDTQGNYKEFNLTEEQWEELHIATWLHDCGKIVTPEYIVDKSTKLETIYDRLNEVRMRFELLKNDAQKNYWMHLAKGGNESLLAQQRDELISQLDEEFNFIAECNIGGEFMSDEKIEQLQAIANRTWTRTLNNKIGIAPHQANKIPETPLPTQEHVLSDKAEHLVNKEHAELTKEGNEWGFNMVSPEHRFNRGELYNLSVKRGTLTDEDRFIINGHMVHTIVMLSKLPFPEHLQQIPLIAGGHHEKMDGTGYPRKIKAAELPTTARILVVADIFEALTASDRPYKERKTLGQAIKIMSFMVKDDHIDPEVFKLFLTSGVYLQYAKDYLLEDQIDEVDISQYL